MTIPTPFEPFSMTIHGIERDLIKTPEGRGGTIRHTPGTPGWGASGCHGDYLLKEWSELVHAHAAERKQANRAERERDEAYRTIRALTGTEATP